MAYERIPREQVTATFEILTQVLHHLQWGVAKLPDPGFVHAVLDTIEELADQVNEPNRRLDTVFRAVARALDEIRIAEAELNNIVDVAEAILREGTDGPAAED